MSRVRRDFPRATTGFLFEIITDQKRTVKLPKQARYQLRYTRKYCYGGLYTIMLENAIEKKKNCGGSKLPPYRWVGDSFTQHYAFGVQHSFRISPVLGVRHPGLPGFLRRRDRRGLRSGFPGFGRGGPWIRRRWGTGRFF